MDANGTHYHLIYGVDDWGACLSSQNGLQSLREQWALPEAVSPVSPEPPGWDNTSCELVLPSRIFQFNRAPGDTEPKLSDRRGAAGDAYGNLYWVSDDEQGLMVRSVGSGKVSIFWSSVGQSSPSKPQAAGFQPVATDPVKPLLLRGLAVTKQHYLVVGVLDPAGLLIFDLHAGGPPEQLRWPAAPAGLPPFAPFDMAARSDGGVWILDRQVNAPAIARLWSLDRRLNVIDLNPPAVPAAGQTSIFQPVETASPIEGKAHPPQAALSYDAAVVLRSGAIEAVNQLTAIEALPDQSAILLDNSGDGGNPPFAKILRYSPQGNLLPDDIRTRLLQDKVDPALRPTFSLVGDDFVFLPASSGADSSGGQACCGQSTAASSSPLSAASGSWGTLIIVAQDGNQAYAFTLYAAGSPLGDSVVSLESAAQYLPMRLFAGRGLIVGSANGAARAYYDSGRSPVNWVPLVEQRRPRYADQTLVFTPLRMSSNAPAGLRSAFDGGQPDCVWHRLMIDGCIPPGTQVAVWSRAANTETDLALTAWQPEPQPYLRSDGSELPYLRKASQPANLASQPADPGGAGTWELLFQQAFGRFIQVKIRLSGDGRSTPRLRAVRLYYPRFSYLEHYMPAAYRQDPAPASFLDRYLANLEGIYTTLEDRIAAVQVLFDERTIPAEYLDWLGSWTGTVFDPTWEEDRKRLFLAHAAELYSQRGTLLGLVRMIRLATDPCPTERIFSETLDYEPGKRTSPVRIIELFRTREVPAVVFGDPSLPEAPSLQTISLTVEPWMPALGARVLHEYYQSYLTDEYGDIQSLQTAWNAVYPAFDQITFPPLQPEDPQESKDWQSFLNAALSFPYAAVTADDLGDFRDFLARRYGYIAALNSAYPGAAWTQFEDVPFPTALPENSQALFDWIEFVSIVVPTRRSAHQFTVLVPTVTGAQTEQGSEMLDRVAQVVELEKPAHTTFTVKEYWALFRVGEARLGFDTQLDTGSRLTPLVLDASYLVQGYLNYSHPWFVANRVVLGNRGSSTRDANVLGPSARPKDSRKE